MDIFGYVVDIVLPSRSSNKQEMTFFFQQCFDIDLNIEGLYGS